MTDERTSDDVNTYIQLFILLYADDTVIFGTDETEFQNNLNAFYEFSNMWRLDINYDKTKILIFGTRNDDSLISKWVKIKYKSVKSLNI